jgi:hypothetical protein
LKEKTNVKISISSGINEADVNYVSSHQRLLQLVKFVAGCNKRARKKIRPIQKYFKDTWDSQSNQNLVGKVVS